MDQRLVCPDCQQAWRGLCPVCCDRRLHGPLPGQVLKWTPLTHSGRMAVRRVGLVDGMAGLASAIARAELRSMEVAR